MCIRDSRNSELLLIVNLSLVLEYKEYNQFATSFQVWPAARRRVIFGIIGIVLMIWWGSSWVGLSSYYLIERILVKIVVEHSGCHGHCGLFLAIVPQSFRSAKSSGCGFSGARFYRPSNRLSHRESGRSQPGSASHDSVVNALPLESTVGGPPAPR